MAGNHRRYLRSWIITESQKGSGRKGPQGVTGSNLPVQAGSPMPQHRVQTALECLHQGTLHSPSGQSHKKEVLPHVRVELPVPQLPPVASRTAGSRACLPAAIPALWRCRSPEPGAPWAPWAPSTPPAPRAPPASRPPRVYPEAPPPDVTGVAVTSGGPGRRPAGGGGAPPRWRTRSRCARCRAAPSAGWPITAAPPRRSGTAGTGRAGALGGRCPLSFPYPSPVPSRGRGGVRPSPSPAALRRSRTARPLRGEGGKGRWPRRGWRRGVSAVAGSRRPPRRWPLLPGRCRRVPAARLGPGRAAVAAGGCAGRPRPGCGPAPAGAAFARPAPPPATPRNSAPSPGVHLGAGCPRRGACLGVLSKYVASWLLGAGTDSIPDYGN